VGENNYIAEILAINIEKIESRVGLGFLPKFTRDLKGSIWIRI